MKFDFKKAIDKGLMGILFSLAGLLLFMFVIALIQIIIKVPLEVIIVISAILISGIVGFILGGFKVFK